MFVKHLCPPLGIHCRVHKPLLWAVHSVNQISFQYVQSLQRKWTKTANYWNFLSPRGHNSVQNGLIVPKSELGLDIVMVNLYTKFHFNMCIHCKKNKRKQMMDRQTDSSKAICPPFFEGGQKYHNNLTKVLKILNGQNFPISSLNDLNLWPIDLKINRDLPLLITNPHMKYHNNLTKGSQDIERTNIPISSSNDLDLWPIDLKINRGLPLLVTNPHMKYHNNLTKGSQDIERTKYSYFQFKRPWSLRTFC